MKILGLDISTKSTGWFLSKKAFGIISPPQELSFSQKLSWFRSELLVVLEKHKPDIAIIEDAYYRPGFGNIHTLKTLVKFAGVALEACATLGIETEVITATTARKYCCGKQETPLKKPGVFKYFVEKYKLDWKFDKMNDVTDAMTLAWGYRGIKRDEKTSTKK